MRAKPTMQPKFDGFDVILCVFFFTRCSIRHTNTHIFSIIENKTIWKCHKRCVTFFSFFLLVMFPFELLLCFALRSSSIKRKNWKFIFATCIVSYSCLNILAANVIVVFAFIRSPSSFFSVKFLYRCRLLGIIFSAQVFCIFFLSHWNFIFCRFYGD